MHINICNLHMYKRIRKFTRTSKFANIHVHVNSYACKHMQFHLYMYNEFANVNVQVNWHMVKEIYTGWSLGAPTVHICVAVCAAVCVAVCAAVCLAVCLAVCVALSVADFEFATHTGRTKETINSCVAVCVAMCVAVCVAVYVAGIQFVIHTGQTQGAATIK